MEILEIVAGPLPARLLGQYFAVVARFPGGGGRREYPRRRAPIGRAAFSMSRHDPRAGDRRPLRHWRGLAAKEHPGPRRIVCGPEFARRYGGGATRFRP